METVAARMRCRQETVGFWVCILQAAVIALLNAHFSFSGPRNITIRCSKSWVSVRSFPCIWLLYYGGPLNEKRALSNVMVYNDWLYIMCWVFLLSFLMFTMLLAGLKWRPICIWCLYPICVRSYCRTWEGLSQFFVVFHFDVYLCSTK